VNYTLANANYRLPILEIGNRQSEIGNTFSGGFVVYPVLLERAWFRALE
jgi:hypothetical protein